MTYPILNVPSTGNSPASQYTAIATNFTNISSYLSVDHVAPASAGAGYHNQVNLNAALSAPTLSGTISQIFPSTSAFGGNQKSAGAQLFFQNSYSNGAPFLASAVRAFGTVWWNNGSPQYDHYYNMESSITVTTSGSYKLVNITPLANAINSQKFYTVLITARPVDSGLPIIRPLNGTSTGVPYLVNPSSPYNIQFQVVYFNTSAFGSTAANFYDFIILQP
ncbi:MAG: hypothetical protein KGN01_05040 [Patescibacteria group bacterium]|nr:hypothetical protein [Patescibacteria group bacterium]